VYKAQNSIRPNRKKFDFFLKYFILLFASPLPPCYAQYLSPSPTLVYSGSAATATINTGGQYQITLAGAAGGSGYDPPSSTPKRIFYSFALFDFNKIKHLA
jgi:hypothetical protein